MESQFCFGFRCSVCVVPPLRSDSGIPFEAALNLRDVLFLFFFLMQRVILVSSDLWQSITGVSQKAVLGPLICPVMRRREDPSSSYFPLDSQSACISTHTLTHLHTDILLNGRALPLPQSMEYHICLFTPRFLSLNPINIYIAAEGVGSPSCRGGNSA